MSSDQELASAAVRNFGAAKGIFMMAAIVLFVAFDRPLGAADEPQRHTYADPAHPTEKAVAASLYWLAHHQAADGSWSLQDYAKQCKDKSCTGKAAQESTSAATAMGVLPLLSAGQTQLNDGPFKTAVQRGIDWLSRHQAENGDLSAGSSQQMYAHGLAAIALCEDYRMTHDKEVGAAAQKAIDFIQDAQNQQTGGWRYRPGEDGDTSVFGWQMTAIRSARGAGLKVKPAALDGAKKWLASVSKSDASGKPTGRFSYVPDGGPTPTMSAVGILCNQYLKVDPSDPSIAAGAEYLMASPPDKDSRNVYYWFFATQAMHNMSDKNWDVWNRKVRAFLVESQDREGCAAGSWDPEKPTRDAWGPIGGRLMTTSLSCLILEVYYRWGIFSRIENYPPPH